MVIVVFDKTTLLPQDTAALEGDTAAGGLAARSQVLAVLQTTLQVVQMLLVIMKRWVRLRTLTLMLALEVKVAM